MSLLRNITSGLRSLFRREQVGRELDEELRAVRLERGSLEVSKWRTGFKTVSSVLLPEPSKFLRPRYGVVAPLEVMK